ncbi:MAG TPA: VIT domain-containing protein [Pyrinomonadaceae bacterium]|nr:VIT domain-containing protein [Pyrinomonadaceae bacterium]
MEEYQQKPALTGIHKFTLFAGVIMPVISITVEATTHVCAETFFDPIPTMWHLLLVIFVPLAQLHVWFVVRRGANTRPVLTGLVNAVAIGVSLFYSLVYIPLLPLAALTLLFVVGVLPLAPLLSLVASIVMRVQLKQVAATTSQTSFALRKAGLFAGFAIAAASIVAMELPASLTRYGLKLAASSSPETRGKGIRFLRTFGSREYLLRTCYGRSGWATDLVGSFFSVQDPVTPAEAQRIYYRVTGDTFDSFAPPRRVGGTLIADEADFDNNQGGDVVAGKVKGLSLFSSKLDGSMDPNGGLGYMEWTLVFRNESPVQREARTEIQLPPGAVVSRLTLWVNGEPREAAFAGKGKVKQAYQQVVQQRRDPVLVTTAGRDRIMVQCFPVPSYNGEMKIRLGITVPLVVEDLHNARLLLPHFVNRNFNIPNDFTHSTWIESKSPMTTSSRSLLPSQFSETSALGGGLQDFELSQPETSIKFPLANRASWSKDPFERSDFIVQQSIVERVPVHVYRIVLVLDTSEGMEDAARELQMALGSIPSHFDVKLVFANSDEMYDLTASGIEKISLKLGSATFAGGADNTPALLKGWDLAAEKPGNNVIVWVHGPQLMHLHSIEELRQRWERRPYGPVLYSVRTSTGSDEIEKGLDGINEVKSVARMDYLEKDLENLFKRLTGQTKTLEYVRTSRKVEEYPHPVEAIETSDHLARLWANDEVARILSARDDEAVRATATDAAITIASRYQLVTPVTGAVVLETAQQYSASGLTPVDPGTVPTIPEPEIVALLIVVAVFLSWLLYRQYRKVGGGCTV